MQLFLPKNTSLKIILMLHWLVVGSVIPLLFLFCGGNKKDVAPVRHERQMHKFLQFFFSLISSTHDSEDIIDLLAIFCSDVCSPSPRLFGLDRLQNTIFLMRWSTPSQFPDGRINTFYSGAVIHHLAQLCDFCEGSLRVRFIATWSPYPRFLH